MIETDLIRVTQVRHVRDHVLQLEFSDGLSGEVDLTDHLRGEMFEPLRDPEFFARVHIEGSAVAWENGVDWAPEDLHERVRASKGLPPQSSGDSRQRRRAYVSTMPEISRFFGIVIRMLATEHAPPHFHAVYGEYEIAVNIRDGVVTGRFPRRALRLVLEWGELHQDELLSNWDRMRQGAAPLPIAPLE